MTSTNMSAERWQRLTQIVNDCLDLPADARSAHARTLCADDEALHREAMQWIKDAEQTQGFLDQSADVDLLTLRPGVDDIARHAESALQWTDKRLGPYRITEEIARGGMGSVFKAVRADDAYEQIVAIKVVRSHVATELIAQRFRAERQILANLEHPHIARLLDGGQSDDGTPYLVMEYVDGKPIDEFCESRGLSVNERLKLFRDVCSAVQYAHQRLIVHRDLKPSNILVNEAGQVKLLDFGIAKLVDSAQLDEHGNAVAMPTEANAMTPAYASPEQIKGEAITTSSDVYALGVLLYRLLTGRSPYKANNTQPLALAKEIVETDPERPSTVVTQPESSRPTERTVDTNEIKKNLRTLDSKRLQNELRGDLDNVVLMALRKDPQRRYASAEQMAEDVRRYENSEPVLAHADSLTYRTRKFVQRNRVVVLFSGLAMIGLVALTSTALYQTAVARAEKARAEKHFASVRKLVNTALFDVHKSIKDLPGSTLTRNSLVQTAVDYLEELSKDVGTDAVLMGEIGTGYVALSEIQGTSLTDAQLGNQSAGRTSLERGLKYLSDAYAEEPTNADISYKFAQALRKSAEFEWVNLRFEAASNSIERAIAVGQLEVTQNRATISARLELSAALITKARTSPAKLVPRDVRANAATAAQSILETLQKEQLNAHDKDRTLQNLSVCYDTLSEIVSDQDKPESLLRAYDLAVKSLAIKEARSLGYPDDKLRAFSLAGSYHAVATTTSMLKRFTESAAFRRKGVDVYARLSELDAADQNAKMFHIYGLAMLAEAQVEINDMTSAEQALVQALALRKAIPAENLNVMYHRAALFTILMVQTVIEVDRANRTDAAPQQRVEFCAKASAKFQEARVVQASIKDLFLEADRDPAGDVLQRLQFCAKYARIPS